MTYLNTDEYLHEHLALKGGTAINMTIFNLLRLSVDLDLDFKPNLPLEDMKKAREKIAEMLERYMIEEEFSLSESSRYSHSLDSMLFQYQNAGGNKDNIKLELNYSLRSHIFVPVERKIATDIFEKDVYFDLFDETEYELFRKCIIFYASISADKINKAFDTSAIDGLKFSKIRRDLFPVLRKKDNFNLDERKEEAKNLLRNLWF